MATEAASGLDPKVRACGACGAVNGVEFETCIRCRAFLRGPPPTRAAESSATPSSDAAPVPFDRVGAKLLLGLTLMVFGTGLLAGAATGTLTDALVGQGVAEAIRYGALLPALDAVKHEPFRLLSAVFVHFGALHLAANMLGFWQLSRIAEPAIGWSRLVVAYVVTGVLGFAATVAVDHFAPGTTLPTAGGSGAIFGLMGLALGWMLRRRDPRWKAFAAQAVLLSLLFGFGLNAMHAGILVNNSAHVGGLVVGVLFGFAFAGKGPGLGRGAWNALAGLALAASVVSLVLAQLSPTHRQFLEPSAAEEEEPR